VYTEGVSLSEGEGISVYTERVSLWVRVRAFLCTRRASI
jgi:hypothetical protein